MNSYRPQWSKLEMFITRPILVFALTLLFVVQSVLAEDNFTLRESSRAALQAGNYQDAYQGFRALLLDKKDSHDEVAEDLAQAAQCLQNLNRVHEFDSFIEDVIRVHSTNWKLLYRAAGLYASTMHYGYLISSKFERGFHRGGGKYVSSIERDRVRALQLFDQAARNISAQDDKNKIFRFNLDYARFIVGGEFQRPSWKLQYLTDLAKLPDYDETRYGTQENIGAPIGPDGVPIYYSVPKHFDQAINDGERFRFLLEAAEKTMPSRSAEVRMTFANFLLDQFGTKTVAAYGNYFARYEEEPQSTLNATFALHTLNEEETIARLATGIKRFKLPDEFNPIKLLKQIAQAGDDSGYVDAALQQLAQVFEDRRQFDTAARYWKESIERYGKSDHKQERLTNILGAWGRFEDTTAQAEGKEAEVQYRFRNGTSVQLEAYQIKLETLLADVKEYLKSDPARFDYDQINIENLGFRLVEKNETKYLGNKIASWSQPLEPFEKHFDRRTTIRTPLKESGAYLVQAKIAGGNLTKIVLWLHDTAIVEKHIDQGSYYFVADAVSGKPLAGVNVELFGYRSERIENANFTTKILGRTFHTLTKSFSKTTDAQGQVVLGDADRGELNRYRWVVTVTGEKNRLAYLGFSGIWRSKYSDSQYQEQKYFTITDRPVYRPGQKVQFKVWARHTRYDEENTSSLAGSSLSIEVKNPRDEKLYAKNFVLDKFGGLHSEITLPEEATLGVYSVCISSSGGYCRSIGSFRVEEYKKPEFEVTIAAPKEPLMLGEKATATISAKYYFGEAVRQGTLKYKVLRYTHDARWFPWAPWDWLFGPGYWWFAYDCTWFPGWMHWGMRAPIRGWWFHQTPPPEIVQESELPLDQDGSVQIEIDTTLAKELHGDEDHRYEITAEVVDQSRRTIVGSGEVLVSRKPFSVYAWVNRGHYLSGEVIQAQFSAQTIDLQPVQGSGTLKLLKISYDSKGAPLETLVESWKLPTDNEGKAKQQIKAGSAGQYRLSYSVTDSKGHEIEGGYVLTIRGEGEQSFRFNDLELIPDKQDYQAGEKVKLLINTNAPSGTVVLFVRPVNGTYLMPTVLTRTGKSTVYEIEVSKKDMPNFFVEAFTVSQGQVFSELREVFVPPEDRALEVTVSPGKDTYRPGEKGKVEVKVTDLEGNPFSGALVLSVYDRAVEYISGGSNVPEIKEFFWKWRRQHHPQTNSSLFQFFAPLVPPGEKAMGNIGLFGELIDEASGEGRKQKKSGSQTLRTKGGVGGAMADGEMALVPAAAPMEVAADMRLMKSEAFAEEAVGGPQQRGGATKVQPTVRTNFADTAYWNALLTTGEDGRAEIDFSFPDSLTSWKIRSWALGHGTKVGEGAAEVQTKKNLLLRLQAPRFFVEQDEVVLSANVHNYLNSTKEVDVILELEGASLQGITAPSQTVTISSNGEKRVDWRVKVSKEGEAVIRMKALSDEESDAAEMRFPVFVHGMLKTEAFSGALRAADSKKSIQFRVPDERRPEQTMLEIRYSPTLALAMVDALPYLVSYPYGCTEQTLSRFLPTVLTQKVLLQMGLNLKDIKEKRTNLNAQERGDSAERAAQWKRFPEEAVFDEEEVRKMAQTGLNRLASMQLEDGGWGWFSGSGERSFPHTTAHIVHGLQIGKKNGLEVPQSIIDRGISWLEHYQAEQVTMLKNGKAKIEPWKDVANDLDSFVYMILVDAHKQNREMMDFLYRDRNKLAVYGKAMFALALFAIEEKDKMSMVKQNIEQFLILDNENQTAYLNLPNEGYWWYWYGSEYETHAYYLKLLSRVEPNSEKAAGLVKYLLNNRKHATYWNSTRDTAVVVEAFADYLQASNEASPELEVEVYLDGKKIREISISKDNLFSFDNVVKLTGDGITSGEHTLELRKTGTGPLYFNAYLENFTLEEFIKKAGLEVKVERKYYKLKLIDASSFVSGSRGQAISQKVEKYERTPLLNMSEVKSGDLIEIELELESKNDYEYLVFEDMKPAGFEPVQVQSGYNGNELGAYVEFRDELVSFFVRTLARGKHSVSYRMRAETPGRFSALPTRAFAMYAPELRGNSDEMKIVVGDLPLQEGQ